MKYLLSGVAVATVAALATAASTPAWSQSSTTRMPTPYATDVPPESGDTLIVKQSGERNVAGAGIREGGEGRLISIDQSGTGNTIGVLNSGNHTHARVSQDSRANRANADVTQAAVTWGVVNLTQSESASAVIKQHDGYVLHADIIQNGSAKLDFDQTGSANYAGIQQINPRATPADPALLTVNQLGTAGTVLVKQAAEGSSEIRITQTASTSGLADVKQTGLSNFVNLHQSNGVQETTVKQSGDHNSAAITYSGPAVVTVTQSGQRNTLNGTGGAWAGLSGTINQSGSYNYFYSHVINVGRPVTYDIRQSGNSNRVSSGIYN